MKIIGVTGGSGSGKSELCRCLAALGAAVLDTDQTAREVVQPGKPALRELAQAFGEQILDSDGTLRRQVLADLVFGEADAEQKACKQAKLNAITHKYIQERTAGWLEEMRLAGQRFCVLDVPLLFESGMDRMCDLTVGVLACVQTRAERIMKRDGLDRVRAENRIAAQPDEAFYRSRCQMLVCNEKNTSREELTAAARAILNQAGRA